ncbi:MAG TPA: hypothetical protein VLA34_11440, partial [Candidatus Krumholzibacterium sp.]|nr:hypothetical protein [Candidatus Krumholzibacterium sp.]
SIFESIWNRDRVECVQITVSEKLGTGSRGGYYDASGAIRDMMQNHIAQLVSLVAMDVPTSFEAKMIRGEKTKVLRAVREIDPERVVRGRYGPGSVKGVRTAAYLDEPGVLPGSDTESFAALRLNIDNWRWQGVPFYLRTGKRLAAKLTQIAIVFKHPPVCIFEPYDTCSVRSNTLFVTLQPDESFTLSFDVKSPGEPLTLSPQKLRFSYRDSFGRLPDAYEALLLDVITGDQTLFVCMDEVEASWNLFTPVIERAVPLVGYEPGSWGPREADALLNRDGYSWSVI